MVKHILVVDDESSVTYTIKHGLEKLDKEFRVTEVNTGMKCLELLKNNQIPDLILLDIMMPEMSGWAVVKKIKENREWKHVPIVFLTARTDHNARQAGAFFGDDFIEKPFEIPALKQRIDKILKR